MPKLDKSERDPLYYEIMNRKFGRFLMWSVPEIMETVGPFDTDPFDYFNKKRSALVSVCQKELHSYSDHNLLVLAGRSKDDPDDIKDKWHRIRDRQIYELEQKEPPWYAGGFGHPDYLADFKYWAQCPFFSPHEALLLSVGVEPEHFSEQQIDTFASRNTEGRARLWKTLQFLVKRREQIQRQFPDYAYHSKISPKDLFAWFELVDLGVHPEFISMYLERPQVSSDPAKACVKTDQREIDSICQLFTAMAIEYFGYVPGQRRSPVTREIVDLAASMGLRITDDTIRKYLRRGEKFISDEWKPREK